jgi:midasin
LCRAIENGHWVLLNNANLCNPTVLDRLNPLLEPNGSLYLNECGTESGGPRVITPHPGFRLFLALDPKHGEVSRAMRNRGIEICVLPDDVDAQADADGLVRNEGFPGSTIKTALVNAYQGIASFNLRHHRQAQL